VALEWLGSRPFSRVENPHGRAETPARPMSTEGNESPRNSDDKPGLAWVLVVAALPLLYMFSIGPAAAFIKVYPQTEETLTKIYFPIILLHKHTPLREPLEWWVELWSK
jgi:hypothetical protein